MRKPVVLAYAGSLETAVAMSCLVEAYDAAVVAVILDLGQEPGGPALEEVRDRALAAGAVRAHVFDVREEFARDFVLPALKAGALDADGRPQGAALSRALAARKLVDVAVIEQADALAHSAVREPGLALEAAARALNPGLTVLAPLARIARAGTIDHAKMCTDVNLWGRTLTWRDRGEPWAQTPERGHAPTRLLAECPDEPAFIEIAFDRGTPIAINGVAMPLVDLIVSLGVIAGAHGVGSFDTTQSDAAGLGWREILDAPAAIVLHTAHRALQELVMPDEVDRFQRSLSAEYRDLIESGLWFSPLREALDAAVERLQQRVSGTIRMRLCENRPMVIGWESPFARDGRRGAASDSTRRPGLAAGIVAPTS